MVVIMILLGVMVNILYTYKVKNLCVVINKRGESFKFINDMIRLDNKNLKLLSCVVSIMVVMYVIYRMVFV